MMGGYGMAGGYGLGGFFMILWWALIIFGTVMLVRWLRKSNRAEGGSGNKALDILKERYARGKIGEVEFQKRKQDISP